MNQGRAAHAARPFRVCIAAIRAKVMRSCEQTQATALAGYALRKRRCRSNFSE
jgi:hypothetical protein